MKKIITTIFLILIVIIFVAIMNSGFFLKKSFTSDDDVLKHLYLVETAITNNKWEIANLELEKVFKAWKKIKNRVQFSVEKGHIEKIDNELATLKGTLKVINAFDAIIIIEKIKILWDELAK